MQHVDRHARYLDYPLQNEWYESDRIYFDLKELFLEANRRLLQTDQELFRRNVCERSICGALMLKLKTVLFRTPFGKYNIDTEYNRNYDGIKRILVEGDEKPWQVFCDLIVHSRGKYKQQDNLIAVEMKKEIIVKARRRIEEDL